MTEILNDRFLLRGGLKAALVSLNEVPLRREMIVELDDLFTSGKFNAKIGDGATHYIDLPYLQAGGGVESVSEGDGITIDNSDPKNPIISSDLGSLAVSGRVATYEDLPSPPPQGETSYLVEEDGLVYIWSGGWPEKGSGVNVSAATSAVPLSAVESYKTRILTRSPWVFYKLDETSGSPKAVDSSGNGNDLPFTGSIALSYPKQIVRGRDEILGAFFNNTTGYARDSGYTAGVPTSLNGCPATLKNISWTWQAIIQLRVGGGDVMFLQRLGKDAATDSSGANNIQFQVRIYSGAFYTFWQNGAHINNSLSIGSASRYYGGSPILLTFRKDAVAKRFAVFVNGAKQYDVAYSSEPDGGSKAGHAINVDLASNYNSALMALMAMWPSAASDSDILADSQLLGFASSSGVIPFDNGITL